MRRVARAADARRSPWKNGGGTTAERAVHPPGAGFDDFGWRISTAEIAAEAPFSPLPGVDRTLVLVAGVLDLSLEGRPALRLDVASAPFAFPGDAPCRGRPVGGPVTAFNVMTRRSAWAHAVRRLDLQGTRTLDAEADGAMLFVLGGTFAAGPDVLAPGDLIVFEGSLELSAPGGTGLVARIRRR